jgi:hypothetical protein
VTLHYDHYDCTVRVGRLDDGFRPHPSTHTHSASSLRRVCVWTRQSQAFDTRVANLRLATAIRVEVLSASLAHLSLARRRATLDEVKLLVDCMGFQMLFLGHFGRAVRHRQPIYVSARSSKTNCSKRRGLCHDLAAILDARIWVSDKASRVQHTRCGFGGPVRLVRGRRHPCTPRHHFSIAAIMGSVALRRLPPGTRSLIADYRYRFERVGYCCDAAICDKTATTRRQAPCRMSCKLMCSDSNLL